MIVDEIELTQEQLDMLVKGFQSIGYYGRNWFPNTLYAPFEKGHQPLLDIIDKDYDYIVIKALRGIGKTTFAKLIVCRALHYDTAKFVVYVSQTESKAMLETEDVKAKMLTCKKRSLFKPVKIHRSATITGLEGDFSKKIWVYGDQSVVLPRGAGQQILGLNWHDWRPDLIVFDDLVDKATVNNPRIREELNRWFFSDVIETKSHYEILVDGVSKPRQKLKVVYIDTLKHADDQMSKLWDDPEFRCVNIRICDDNFKTNFPISRPQWKLDKAIDLAKRRGLFADFCMNFLGEEPNLEKIKFSKSMFRYYRECDVDFVNELRRGELLNVMISDPAGTVGSLKARTAYVIWSLNLIQSKMYIREAKALDIRPNDLYRIMAEKIREYDVSILGVEFTGLNEYIKQPVEDMLSTENLTPEVMWLTPRQVEVDGRIFSNKKMVRIGALHPYYQWGNILHRKDELTDYEAQLLSYPTTKDMVDLIDSAAYIVQIMNEKELVLLPSVTTFDQDAYERDLENLYNEEQYSNIRYEPPLRLSDEYDILPTQRQWDRLSVTDGLAI